MPLANPKSEELLHHFKDKGCLIRMIESSEKELKALQTNASGGLMIRPSSLIHRDFKSQLYGSGGLGIFIKPSASQGAYKRMTFSNHADSIIKRYDEEKAQDEKLIDFLIKELNKKDGGGNRDKASLRNLTIEQLHYKQREFHDRAAGIIDDIDTKIHVKNLLEKLEEQSVMDVPSKPLTKVDFKVFVDHQDSNRYPDYLKGQIKKKFESYFEKAENKSIKGIIHNINRHQLLKSQNWSMVKTDIRADKEDMQFDPARGLIFGKKQGSINLLEVDNYLKSEGSSNLFRETFSKLFPDHGEMISYEQIEQCCDKLTAEVKKENTRPIYSNPQHTNSNKPGYRELVVTECIATPSYDDILGIQFSVPMSDELWEQAKNFQEKMEIKGYPLNFFSYDANTTDNPLIGPFTLEEARQLQPKNIDALEAASASAASSSSTLSAIKKMNAPIDSLKPNVAQAIIEVDNTTPVISSANANEEYKVTPEIQPEDASVNKSVSKRQ